MYMSVCIEFSIRGGYGFNHACKNPAIALKNTIKYKLMGGLRLRRF
jgi:hypothetical protein